MDRPSWRSAAFTLVAFVTLPVCGSKPDSSNLAQRAHEVGKSGASARETTPVAKAEVEHAVATPTQADTKAAPPPGERVDLWLDLDPAKTVRILTVGMLELPLVNQPTGFAREEDLRVRECTGDGAARRCVIEHHYGRFEAEPPTGKILEQDEKRFTDVVTHHSIDARGRREGDTTVKGPPGPPDFADGELGRALVAVHRYACIRLPSEAVGVGAKWSDSCHFVFGGQVARQDVAWELTALSDDPVSGKRAELTMLGKLAVPAEGGGERVGTIEGKLYFFVDAHQPHILRLRAQMPLKPGQKLQSTTTINLQFGLLGPGDVVTRTDGQPLTPAPAAVTPPSAAPPGASAPAPGGSPPR